MSKTPTIGQRIVAWQESRGLIKTPEDFNVKVETTNVLEELIEINDPLLDSHLARGNAVIAADMICDNGSPHRINDHNTVDGLCDIIVFATGAIAKLGYSPDIALKETLDEIESRRGSIIDGKFVKDESEDAKAEWYKADYSLADMKPLAKG